MASVYVLLDKDDMQYDRSLRQLWYKSLTPELLAGYKPLHVDEQLLIDTQRRLPLPWEASRAPLG